MLLRYPTSHSFSITNRWGFLTFNIKTNHRLALVCKHLASPALTVKGLHTSPLPYVFLRLCLPAFAISYACNSGPELGWYTWPLPPLHIRFFILHFVKPIYPKPMQHPSFHCHCCQYRCFNHWTFAISFNVSQHIINACCCTHSRCAKPLS